MKFLLFQASGRPVGKLKWLLPAYLFLAPFIIAGWQAAVLEWPTQDVFFADGPYNPFPQIFYVPLFRGIVSATLVVLVTLVFLSNPYSRLRFRTKLLILLPSAITTTLVFWLGINLAQRAVVLEYFSATDANGLHFLFFFTPPVIPVPYGWVPFAATIVGAVLGIIGMVVQYAKLFNHKRRIDSSDIPLARPPFWVKLSIAEGNLVQLDGLLLGGLLIYLAAHTYAAAFQVFCMIVGWLIIYISGHSLAHWLVGRMAGIRFVAYGIRGTDHPETLSPVMRAVLSRLPMFTAITDKESMNKATPMAKALMFAAGETSTILGVLLIGVYAWWNNLPGGWLVLIVSVLMSITGVISTTRMPRGDYAKARRALRGDRQEHR